MSKFKRVIPGKCSNCGNKVTGIQLNRECNCGGHKFCSSSCDDLFHGGDGKDKGCTVCKKIDKRGYYGCKCLEHYDYKFCSMKCGNLMHKRT